MASLVDLGVQAEGGWWSGRVARALFEQSALPLAVLDADARYVTANQAISSLTGMASDELAGRTLVDVHGPAIAEAEAAVRTAVATGEVARDVPLGTSDPDGRGPERHWLLDVLPLVGDDGAGRGAVVLAREVTQHVVAERERLAASAELVKRSQEDALTGLANRRTLFRELEWSLHRGLPVSVVFCDLDDFKSINDRHGHTSGDRVLRAVGRRIAHAARQGDLAARFGGDEFVVLVRAALDPAGLEDLAARYRRAIAQPVYVEGRRLLLDASVGAATAEPGDSADDVVRAADDSMYRAKRRAS